MQLFSSKVKGMYAWFLHGEKEGNIFMNINKQLLAHNLN